MNHLNDLVRNSTLIFNLPLQYIRDNIDELLHLCIRNSATSQQATANAIFLICKLVEDRSLAMIKNVDFCSNNAQLIEAVLNEDRQTGRIYAEHGLPFLLSAPTVPTVDKVTDDLIKLDLVHCVDYSSDTVLKVIARCNMLIQKQSGIWSEYLKKRYDTYFDILYCELTRFPFPRVVLELCLGIRANKEIRDAIDRFGDNYRVALISDRDALFAVGFEVSHLDINADNVKPDAIEKARRDIASVGRGCTPPFLERARNKNNRRLNDFMSEMREILNVSVGCNNMQSHTGVEYQNLHPSCLSFHCSKDGQVSQLSPGELGDIHPSRMSNVRGRKGDSLSFRDTRHLSLSCICRAICTGSKDTNEEREIGSRFRTDRHLIIPRDFTEIEEKSGEYTVTESSIKDGDLESTVLLTIKRQTEETRSLLPYRYSLPPCRVVMASR